MRQQAQERAVLLKWRRARAVAYHEIEYAIVAAYLGLMPEQIGLEVAAHFDAGAVVTPADLSASRTKRTIVLAAGGLAEECATGIAARGIGSDEARIGDLGLGPGTETAARRRAGQLVADLWPVIEAVVPCCLSTATWPARPRS